MNLVTINQNNNTALKMNSQQIAEMLGSRHDNVKRSIEGLVNKGIISDPQLEDGIRSANGTAPLVYVFEGEAGKRDSIIAIAQLSPQHTAILVDRWIELEKQVAASAFKIPTTLGEALRLAADQQDVIELQTLRLAVAAPKEQFFDTVAKSNALQSVSEVAKKQGISAQALNKVLRSINIYDNRYPRKNIFKDKVMQQQDGKLVLDKSGRSVSMFTNKGEINIVNNFLYTESAIAIVEKHYHYDDKKLKAFKANAEARAVKPDLERTEARSSHTRSVMNTIDSLIAS